MRGLKELRIKLDGTSSTGYTYTLPPLKSLRRLNGLDVFQIYIPRNVNESSIQRSRSYQLISVREWPQQ